MEQLENVDCCRVRKMVVFKDVFYSHICTSVIIFFWSIFHGRLLKPYSLLAFFLTKTIFFAHFFHWNFNLETELSHEIASVIQNYFW